MREDDANGGRQRRRPGEIHGRCAAAAAGRQPASRRACCCPAAPSQPAGLLACRRRRQYLVGADAIPTSSRGGGAIAQLDPYNRSLQADDGSLLDRVIRRIKTGRPALRAYPSARAGEPGTTARCRSTTCGKPARSRARPATSASPSTAPAAVQRGNGSCGMPAREIARHFRRPCQSACQKGLLAPASGLSAGRRMP